MLNQGTAGGSSAFDSAQPGSNTDAAAVQNSPQSGERQLLPPLRIAPRGIVILTPRRLRCSNS